MSSSYQPLVPAALSFNDDGLPMSAAFGDVYHPAWGALEQATRVFLAGNGLPARWQGKDSFTVCETGFGLGHNFLALWQAWRSDPQRCARLHVVSFEAHPFTRQDLAELMSGRLSGPEKELAQQLVAAWPPLLPGLHRLEFEGGQLTLTLAFGSVQRMARQISARVDAYFLDGFAPRVNPEMWSRSLFGQLVRMANAGATAATWCCAGEMRRSLRDAGFLVSKLPGYGGKREMTVATLRPGMGRSGGTHSPSTSIIVVGGGLAGAGIAQALSLRGHRVTVLDPIFARGLGASHEGHLAAALSPVLSRDDDIRARLSRAGVARALQRWQGLQGDARPLRCGTLELAGSDADAAERRGALELLRFPTEWVRWMDRHEASSASGLALRHGGLWFRDGQRVMPVPLLEALLAADGVYCKVRSAAQLTRCADSSWVVVDADGNQIAAAQHVIIANAAQAGSLLGSLEQAPQLAKMQAMYQMAGQVSYFDSAIAPDGRAIVSGDGYWLPAVGNQCVGGSTYVLDAAASKLTTQGHEEVMHKLTALMDFSAHRSDRAPEPVGGWAGWRAAVADRLPVIGPLDATPGLWLACAYGSRGLSWSALAGDIIAAQICNEPVPLERELLQKIAPR